MLVSRQGSKSNPRAFRKSGVTQSIRARRVTSGFRAERKKGPKSESRIGAATRSGRRRLNRLRPRAHPPGARIELSPGNAPGRPRAGRLSFSVSARRLARANSPLAYFGLSRRGGLPGIRRVRVKSDRRRAGRGLLLFPARAFAEARADTANSRLRFQLAGRGSRRRWIGEGV